MIYLKYKQMILHKFIIHSTFIRNQMNAELYPTTNDLLELYVVESNRRKKVYQ